MNEKKIDINYWIRDVEFGQRRGRIIGSLLDLMDKNYQMQKWPIDVGGYGFDTQIGFAVDMFFDELSMDSYISNKKSMYENIGIYLKTNEEANCFLNLGKIMNNLLDEVFKVKSIHFDTGTDQEYLSSPYLSPMRKAAKNCFVVFMENEKENKEFCEFVLKAIVEDYAYKADPAKSAYENIVAYSNSIIEF